MFAVNLVHPSETFQVRVRPLVSQCDLFEDASLLTVPYNVRSSVKLAIFQDFVSAIEGKVVQITNDNVSGLELLCTEFGFQTLADKVSEFKASPAFRASVESSTKKSVGSLPSAQAAIGFDSLIISVFPEIFQQFVGKEISFLWRGSRHGFEADEFHRRCDGHANTLTLIVDRRNIFGSFPPVCNHNGAYFIHRRAPTAGTIFPSHYELITGDVSPAPKLT
jgi:hypothetical protein